MSYAVRDSNAYRSDMFSRDRDRQETQSLIGAQGKYRPDPSFNGSSRGYPLQIHGNGSGLLSRIRQHQQEDQSWPEAANLELSKQGEFQPRSAEPMFPRYQKQPRPVRLTPAWEDRNLTPDQLNFKTTTFASKAIPESKEVILDQAKPTDKCCALFLMLLLHGLVAMLPWNLFITAKSLMDVYGLKELLLKERGNVDSVPLANDYISHPIRINDENKEELFVTYLLPIIAVPFMLSSWFSLYVHCGGTNLLWRIFLSILTQVAVLVVLTVLTIFDRMSWSTVTFWIIFASIVLISLSSGVYVCSVVGLCAIMPSSYAAAPIIGASLSSMLCGGVNLLSVMYDFERRSAAIYLFLCILFLLLAAFDSYFAFPFLNFYKYYERQTDISCALSLQTKLISSRFCYVFRKSFASIFAVVLVNATTYAVYPEVLSQIQRIEPSFKIPEKYFGATAAFLIFGGGSFVGSLFSLFCKSGISCFLYLPSVFYTVFVPFFLLCNYLPDRRIMPILLYYDWAFVGGVAIMAFFYGYLNSYALINAARSIEAEHRKTVGMTCASFILLGILIGCVGAHFLPIIVERYTFSI